MAKKIDVQKLVADLGGPTELQRKLARKGHEITLKGINMWVWRKRVPGPWLVTLASDLGIRLKQYAVDATEEEAQDLSFLD